VAAAVERILDLIESGSSDANKWEEVISLNQKSADLKLAQGKIERDHHLYLSAAQAMEFVSVISRGVREALLLVKERVGRVSAALFDEVELGIIVDDAVRAIETDGEDVRDAVERAISRVVEKVPLDSVDASFLEANTIVQDRIKSMVEK